MDSKQIVLGNTKPAEGGHEYAYVQRSEENMEVDDTSRREYGSISSEQRRTVCRPNTFGDFSQGRKQEDHAESRVLPDLVMDVDIQSGQFCNIPVIQSLKNLKCDEFEYNKDIVQLTIKGKVRKMAKTQKSWSGAHSTLTVMRDTEDAKFEIGHKIAIENEVNACNHLYGTNISPEIYTTIRRDDGKLLDTYMEFIYPGLTLRDVITKHMPMLSKKGLAKGFVDFTTNNLLRTVITMHSKGASHGDLHAGNILLQFIKKSVNVRFVDFEKAREIYGNENAPRNKEWDFIMISLVISDMRRACKEMMGDMFTKDDRIQILTTEDAERLIVGTNCNAAIFGRYQAATVQVLKESMFEREQQFPGTSKG